jgi:hypothetical protein
MRGLVRVVVAALGACERLLVLMILVRHISHQGVQVRLLPDWR